MASSDPIPSAGVRVVTARADAARLAALLGSEHSAMADFILALAAFDASLGWAELGHASLFSFLQRQLRLSNGAAYHRSAAARLAQRFPALAEALRSGQLCLSSIAELAKVLHAENEATVLPRFFGLSAREARELVAELAPHPAPPAREVVTAIAPPRTAEPLLTSEVAWPATPCEQVCSSGGTAGTAPDLSPVDQSPVPALPARPADDAVPLTADLRRLHVTVSRRFLAKLEAAREARAHARPHATTEDLLEEALDLLLAKEEKGRAAAAKKPRHADGTAAAVMGAVAIHVTGARPAAGSATWTEQEALATASEASRRLPPQARRDHVPAHVRHSVWARDQGRCTWPLDGGGTCGSTHRLQLDHTFAAARGGPPSLANLRILCEAHNREAARRTFGHRWMERFGNQAGARDAVAAVGSLR